MHTDAARCLTRLLTSFAVLQLAFAPAAIAVDARNDGQRKTLLVMHFTTSGVDDATRDAIEDLTASAMINTHAFEVITSSDIAKMLEFEAEKLSVGCNDDSCLAEIADAVGADLIVTGRLARLGERFVLKLSLMEPAAAKTVALETVNVGEVEAFADAIQPIAKSFVVASGAATSSSELSSTVFGAGLAVSAVGLVVVVASGVGAAIGLGILADPASEGESKKAMQTLTPIFLGVFALAAVVVLAGAGAATAGAVME